jgi:hypothetical protein
LKPEDNSEVVEEVMDREAKVRNYVGRTIRDKWLAVASLVVALILIVFAGVPRAAADRQRGIDADVARYQAMGQAYLQQAQAIQRGIDANAARYQAMGQAYLQKAQAIQRGIDVAAARYQAMGNSNLGCVVQSAESELAANPELALVRSYRAQSRPVLVCMLVSP